MNHVIKMRVSCIFSPEKGGGYSVLFPDLEGCYTCGDNLEDSLEMAEDALAPVLYGYEKDGRKIPKPSKREALIFRNNEFVIYIICDTMIYRKDTTIKLLKKH